MANVVAREIAPPGASKIILSPIPQAAGFARDMIKHRLTCMGRPDLVFVGQLIGCELVTNVLRHVYGYKLDEGIKIFSNCPKFWIDITDQDGIPLIEVWDWPLQTPQKRDYDQAAELIDLEHLIERYPKEARAILERIEGGS
ncbi:hypothetical protein NE236_39030 [Actinoallomurus purpureus]|uniref:hypothetical protein n=1 Tax=Actinoallomurus purpureus TaxID=478114 RepID=UPI002092DA62|nr:hypothetical protein [Actinoallomurus purpureus]MCO6010969.1 hypothetical protein [Actinoallomurus purpureus]